MVRGQAVCGRADQRARFGLPECETLAPALGRLGRRGAQCTIHCPECGSKPCSVSAIHPEICPAQSRLAFFPSWDWWRRNSIARITNAAGHGKNPLSRTLTLRAARTWRQTYSLSRTFRNQTMRPIRPNKTNCPPHGDWHEAKRRICLVPEILHFHDGLAMETQSFEL